VQHSVSTVVLQQLGDFLSYGRIRDNVEPDNVVEFITILALLLPIVHDLVDVLFNKLLYVLLDVIWIRSGFLYRNSFVYLSVWRVGLEACMLGLSCVRA
jgi:hypothetical protein